MFYAACKPPLVLSLIIISVLNIKKAGLSARFSFATVLASRLASQKALCVIAIQRVSSLEVHSVITYFVASIHSDT